MDKIIVERLEVRNITGVDVWERHKRQPIFLTVTVYIDISAAGDSDALKCSVNYGTLTKHVSAFSESTEYKTVEALALGVIELIFRDFETVKTVTVSVEKPKALLKAKCAGVELTRHKSDSGVLSHVDAYPDQIFISDLEIYAIVGVNPWEREDKQKVFVNLTIYPSHDIEQLGDHVVKPHNYRSVARTVSEFIETSRFKTLEALVTAVASVCTDACHVNKVKVRVSKPSALLFAQAASVEIVREKTASVAVMGAISERLTHIALIALGSNVGDRVGNITRAIQDLCSVGVKLMDSSFLYETAAQYVTDQGAFLNCVVKVETLLDPHGLLKTLKQVEEQVGRVPTFRNGPRVIDLDILFFDGSLVLKTGDLEIPHPRIKERLFVLDPLCDIAPDLEHPTLHTTMRHLRTMLLEKLNEDESPRLDLPVRVTPFPGRLVDFSKRTLVMGILNITSDSFSDGGDFYFEGTELTREFKDRLRLHVENMEAAGCDILDIGGCSTRPGAELVPLAEELRRVETILRFVKELNTNLLISLDTFRADVAKLVSGYGFHLINDVSGTILDPEMARVMAHDTVPICLMHMRGTPKTMTSLTEYSSFSKRGDAPGFEVVRGVAVELSHRVKKAIEAGVLRWNIIIDPGIGFAKTGEQNITLLKHLKQVSELPLELNGSVPFLKNLAGFPLLVGTSRKGFIGKLINKPAAKDRLFGTASTVAACISQGASIVRVHDVQEMVDVVRVSDVLYR